MINVWGDDLRRRAGWRPGAMVAHVAPTPAAQPPRPSHNKPPTDSQCPASQARVADSSVSRRHSLLSTTTRESYAQVIGEHVDQIRLGCHSGTGQQQARQEGPQHGRWRCPADAGLLLPAGRAATRASLPSEMV
jgi:hypothetical protein